MSLVSLIKLKETVNRGKIKAILKNFEDRATTLFLINMKVDQILRKFVLEEGLQREVVIWEVGSKVVRKIRV